MGLRPGLEQPETVDRLRGGIVPGAAAGDASFDSGRISGDALAVDDVLPGPEAPLDSAAPADSVPLNLPDRLPAGLWRRIVAEDEPFAPVGVRVGTYVVRPYVELTTGYDSNALRIPNGKGSLFTNVEGGFVARSDWSRHALDFELRGGYTAYENVSGNNRPEAEGIIRGRIDINSLIRLDTIIRGAITTDSPGSPDQVAGAIEPPLIYESGVDIGLTRRFNRLEVTAAGLIEREDHAPAQLAGGITESQADQNVTGYGVRLRGAYEIMPGLKPFVQVVADHRVYDIVPDSQGYNRDSKGVTGLVGSEMRFSGLLTGTAAIGWTWREYVDPQLDNISGLVFDASLNWEVSGLTTVVLRARSDVEETTVENASGDFVHEIRLEVDHAFRRWLIGNASVAYRIDNYEGAYSQDTFTIAAGFAYKMGRNMELTGQVSHLKLDSSLPGQDYTANVVQVGLRLQR
ncbi:outer membrane beta-barrel protein [Ancylobacter terrae]|uniref:outer membrane beta-barrel protein n=1 Tax=Ancylobacter sp. sgz301288 TaxID=3342077 RepID=UPI003858B90C